MDIACADTTEKRASLVDFDLARWLGHFARNRQRRPEPNWLAPLQVPAIALPGLRQSMMEFQLGDGGGPASLIAWNRTTLFAQSDELRRVIDAWFLEEKEHSRLLGCVVDRLGGGRISTHWSFRLFCAVRRVVGVRGELQILTVTELTSTVYYTLLLRHCDDEALRQALTLILRDEAGHLAFHRERLTATLKPRAPLVRLFHRIQFWLSGITAASVLWTSHNRTARALGATHIEFARAVHHEIGRFLLRLDRRCQERSACRKSETGSDITRLSTRA